MKKIDIKKELNQLYQASAKEVEQINVPAMNYLMADGEGDPNSSASFAAIVEVFFCCRTA